MWAVPMERLRQELSRSMKLIDSDSVARPPFKNSRSTREFFYDMIAEFQQKVAQQRLAVLQNVFS